MSAQLLSVEFLPRGRLGWGTRLLDFSKSITLLLGPNGSGKTPIMHGIAYALGGAVSLPPAIRKMCLAIRIDIRDSNNTKHEITRSIEDNFQASVKSPSKEVFYNDEKEYSARILEILSIPGRSLSESKTGNSIAPYMSILLPAFWVDQDTGWVTNYNPPTTHRFVRDQEEEVVRWLLGVPAKNRTINRTAYNQAKIRLESIDEKIAIKRATLESLVHEAPGRDFIEATELERQKVNLASTLQRYQSTVAIQSKASSTFDAHLRDAARKRDEAKLTLDANERRLEGMKKLSQDLGAEIDILDLNEVAADAFRTLCGNSACQFFRRPEDSYGRRLLYLKDQLKDLETSTNALNQAISESKQKLQIEELQLSNLVRARQQEQESTGTQQTLSTIETLTKQIAEVDIRIAQSSQLTAERAKLDVLLTERAKAEDDVKEERPTGQRRDHGRILDARVLLQTNIIKWLSTLNTKNIYDDVIVDDDLRLFIGGERFVANSSTSGSTRTRVVLAHHAAILETSLILGGAHPHFMFFDTPKQHEIAEKDLRAFIDEFRKLPEKYKSPIQLVISATVADFLDVTSDDRVWRPLFETNEGSRYFGTI
ncbi:AAA family ATPase [Corallococcus sp. 4LFB]|uniref:ATP-binding protein n=1 Tax=Corallococcus sp. 4LFB TaxID=3383249 RepID=UPI0039750AA4